jgi:hypothetical protein
LISALDQALILSTEKEVKDRFAKKVVCEFLYAAIRQHKRADEKRMGN